MVLSARLLVAACAISLLLSLTVAFDRDDYKTGKVFDGDGTYYGPGGWEGGNCAIRGPRPRFYNNYMPLAINTVQYEGMCGACIEYWGEGEGAGANPIVGRKLGVIVDRCPECKYGDIDLSVRGDGRWKVQWKVIPCMGERRISFQFEGSNIHYWKLQPRGMKSPAVKVVVGGVKAYRSQDNHWIAEKDFKTPVKVVVTTVMGEKYVSHISKWWGVVYGGFRSGDDDDDKPKWNNKRKWGKKAKKWLKKAGKKQKKYSKNGKCVKKWHACTGPLNKFGTSHCCNGWWCVKTSAPGFIGNRCEPPAIKPRPKKCVKKWHACSGPNNKSGTSHCCAGYWCVKSSQKNFIGNRCEPPAIKPRPKKCVKKWHACSGLNNKSGTSHCCAGYWCVKSAQKNFIGNRCEPPAKKPVAPVWKCRRHYASCGKYQKWKNKFGQLYPRPHCCRPGSSCKWSRTKWYTGFRCMPY